MKKIGICLIIANIIVNLFCKTTFIHYWIVAIVGLILTIALSISSNIDAYTLYVAAKKCNTTVAELYKEAYKEALSQ